MQCSPHSGIPSWKRTTEAFKYIWRCEKKNGNEDIRKAIWHLKKYLSLKEQKEVEKVDSD